MIVVTGGAGFIGSNLVAALNARGEREILVCDRLRSDGKWRNLRKRVLADVVAPEALLAHMEAGSGIRAVFHLGAISSTTATDGDLVFETNFRFSHALWDWCTRTRTPFIYASSAATYGGGELGFDDDPAFEAHAALRPLNLYGWSKQQFDLLALRRAEHQATRPPQWAGLKFFNVFGPNEYHKGAMQSLVAKVWPDVDAGRPARLFRSHRPDYADGGQLRDFVWVGDVVAVMLWLLDNPGVSGIFNVGTGQARSFEALVSAAYRAVGREPAITFVDMPQEIRGQYQYFTQARMERLRAAGYAEPFTPLEDAVGTYVRDFLAAENRYR
ncbi:ADP-glyceromanno-heptose 6-epimerase [Arenibaculum pallidiluteum]|uniref:ADP-glyceromanno-heptose 6-epimerase n=1 Tax=Arenibaculum pallidiluteum TaxID=2812559 RepID=UPI001A974FE9|nr:ADP-glyceromanno-heptose 6-epimerase [Arenibaculum pallidiluteum]